MKKILVATDLSANSTAALLFAYKLSQLKDTTLVIVHVYHILKPKRWRSHRFENYQKARKEFILTKLNKLLNRTFSNIGAPLINFEVDLQMNPNTVTTILKCAKKHKCEYMCISTQGGRNSKKLIGTSASKLIAKAPIPIFSIPSTYKTRNLNSICYVSDMTNYQKEINKIIEFTKTTDLQIRILHIISPAETVLRATQLETRLLKRTGIAIKTKYILRDAKNTLIEDIDLAIKKIKPSLVAFFLNRSKIYLNSTFYQSAPLSLSLFKKLPILTYKK